MTEFRAIPAADHGIPQGRFDSNAAKVARHLQRNGFEAYIVGGGVRDLLLDANPKDFDVATSATPDEVRATFRNCRLIGRRFRLAHIYFGRDIIEVATFRGQSETPEDDHHTVNGRIVRDNVWGNVEEDARRRDFTINALFYDPVSGEIRDYEGGYEDLQARCLRLIGDPETRYREDPVRMLRAARFMAKLGLEPEPATAEPIARLAPLLRDVPPARLFEEVNKLFLSGHAEQSLEALQRFGLLQHLFPVLPVEDGRVAVSPMLVEALRNTDQRIAEGKPVTPAFLYAVLLWPAVRDRAEQLLAGGQPVFDALGVAGDEILSKQVRSISIPRRFSTVTRHIWSLQPRFRKQVGRRAERLLDDRRFRAAYDFLVLRAMVEGGLDELVEFWTRTQELQGAELRAVLYPDQGKGAGKARRSGKRRRRRRRGGQDGPPPGNRQN